MQQRTMGSPRGPDRVDYFIDVEAQLEAKQRQSSWRRRTEDIDQHGLSITDHDLHNIGKRETAQSWFAKKWIHVIPLMAFLCFFILWWFSYPVHLVIKDGRIVAIHRIEISRELNENHIDLALLASASSPGAWSLQKFTGTNVTEAPNAYQSGFGDQQWKSRGSAHRVKISRGLSDTLVDPALPSLAALPSASNFQNFPRTNETEALKASQTHLL